MLPRTKILLAALACLTVAAAPLMFGQAIVRNASQVLNAIYDVTNVAIHVEGTTGGTPTSVSQSGTWTVQPGNTQNTTAWLTNVPDFASATCNITGAGQNCDFTITNSGVQSIKMCLTNTFTATVIAKASNDSFVNTSIALFISTADFQREQTTTSAAGCFELYGWQGMQKIRVTTSAFTSGTITSQLNGNNTPPAQVTTSLQAGQQAAPTTIANGSTLIPTTAGGNAIEAPILNFYWDGTNWQRGASDTTGRQVIVGPVASGSALAGAPVRIGGSDGTNAKDFLQAALANFPTSLTLTGRNSSGALLSEKGSRWTVVSLPASGTAASASIAAEVGVRHVCDCVIIAAAATSAVTGTTVTVTVADGATNIWGIVVGIPTASGVGPQEVVPVPLCGLNLAGSTNTAMTLAFSAGVTGVQMSATLTGYNVN